MFLQIKRERWVIVKGEEIFCGLARNYQFKSINNIGNTAVKTYLSQNKAETSFASSWRGGSKMLENGEVRAVKVIESLTAVQYE